MYDLIGKELHLYTKTDHGAHEAEAVIYSDLEEGLAKTTLSPSEIDQFMEEILLIGDEYELMDKDDYLAGKVTPVFFGSALNNFGLDIFLKYFAELAPPPQPYKEGGGELRDLGAPFSGFVFKLQANMNPDHRDCSAFVRIVSGKFER
ncbi:peptide chain release factor 3, partial [Arthrospira platensis SPKY1]|nr:peptide chain release factor 3 [Arthrospira platensis SPKY1]